MAAYRAVAASALMSDPMFSTLEAVAIRKASEIKDQKVVATRGHVSKDNKSSDSTSTRSKRSAK